jgi:beta-galactosidase
MPDMCSRAGVYCGAIIPDEKMIKTPAVVVLVALSLALCEVAPAQSLIRNGTDWKDVDGQPIRAHDGGITRVGGTFYWYGTSYESNPKGLYGSRESPWDGFRVYSSADLVNWKDEGYAFRRPEKGWCSIYTSHRAHVIYNERTKKYVMWFFYILHYPGVILMVATSDTPTGPFELLGPRETGGPFGFGQDMNLFKDDDGTAYLVYDDGNRDLRVDKLTDDYLASTKQSIVAVPRAHEAPAMIKHMGKYIVAGSGVRGWAATDTHYAVASSPMGPYGPKKRMSEEKTWGSQITDFVFVRESGRLFAMCDSWWNPDKEDLDRSRYLWFPVEFDPSTEMARMVPDMEWAPFTPPD